MFARFMPQEGKFFELFNAHAEQMVPGIEALVVLTTSGYCQHKSWGFGRIKAVDTVFARFTIDFQTKAGHHMDLGFAAEFLRPISRDHILARKASDIDALRKMAALHHLDLIKLVVQSFNATGEMKLVYEDEIERLRLTDEERSAILKRLRLK